jgi:hypothetical protein
VLSAGFHGNIFKLLLVIYMKSPSNKLAALLSLPPTQCSRHSVIKSTLLNSYVIYLMTLPQLSMLDSVEWIPLNQTWRLARLLRISEVFGFDSGTGCLLS